MIKGIEVTAILALSIAAGIAGFLFAGNVLDPPDVNWTYCAGAANAWSASYYNYREWVVSVAPELEPRMAVPDQKTLQAHFDSCLVTADSYVKMVEENLTQAGMTPFPRRVAKE